MSQRRLKLQSYLVEFAVAVVIAVASRFLSDGVHTIIESILSDLTILIGLFSIIIALSIFIVGLLFSETNGSFIQWLMKNGGEAVYRNAAFYSLAVQLFSIFVLLIMTKVPSCQSLGVVKVFFFILSLIVTANEIRLCYNYLDLKRTYQVMKPNQ